MTDLRHLERIEVETDHPVAIESPDHIAPRGTSRDNSTNPLFNDKLYRILASRDHSPRIMDLGCSGGGFIRSCVDDGCIGVGIEGSDYSRRFGRAEWSRGDGKFLFTADITKPFHVYATVAGDRIPLTFDVITAWEVMEHIATPDIPAVLDNIERHLLPDGLVVMSISTTPEHVGGLHLHQTVQNREWWLRLFQQRGLTHLPAYDAYFNTQYIRGPRQGAPGSFHVVLVREPRLHPAPPRLSLRRRVLDAWVGSYPQRVLKRLLLG